MLDRIANRLLSYAEECLCDFERKLRRGVIDDCVNRKISTGT